MTVFVTFQTQLWHVFLLGRCRLPRRIRKLGVTCHFSACCASVASFSLLTTVTRRAGRCSLCFITTWLLRFGPSTRLNITFRLKSVLCTLAAGCATSRGSRFFLKSLSGIMKLRHRERDKRNGSNEWQMGKNNLSKRTSEKEKYARSVPAANDVQATAVPDPIPADSLPSDTTKRTTLTVTPTFSSPTSISSASSSLSSSAEFSPTFLSTTTVWIPAPKPTSSDSGLSAAPVLTDAPPQATSRRMPVYGVALLVAGGLGLALAALLVLKSCLRRRAHIDRPRPSNPILQESPLFGGKERFSRGIWFDPSFNNLLASHAKGDGWRPLSGGKESRYDRQSDRRQSFLTVQNLAPNNPATAQLSPASMYTTAVPPTDVGVALEFPVPPQTVHSATQPLRLKDKGTEGKTARRRSVTTSMYGGTNFTSPTLTETETVLAYQATRPAPTPGKEKVSLKSSGSRGNSRPARKNVPSSGSQVSLYRSPSASRAAREREKEEPFLYALPTVKSQERRDRDTKALTSALGLSSPPPPSSCFSPVSIYPDDSLSVAHGREYRPNSDAPLSEMPSPSGVHAALGDLMLQDFPSTATFNSLHTGETSGQNSKKSGKGRVNDRPPRVPSPPPLPSLAQMALSNADADYHSPTYSIYGLYEAQRKSKRSSMHN